MDNKAITPVLGVMLLLPTMAAGTIVAMTAINAYIDYTQSHTEYTEAQTERMEILTQCARDPSFEHEYCESQPKGYDCIEVPQGLLCTKQPTREG